MGPCPVNYEAAHQDPPESWTNVFAQLGQTGPPKIRQENTLTIFSLLFDNSRKNKKWQKFPYTGHRNTNQRGHKAIIKDFLIHFRNFYGR